MVLYWGRSTPRGNKGDGGTREVPDPSVIMSNEPKCIVLCLLIRIFDQIIHFSISAHIAHALKLHAEMHVFVAL